MASGPASRKARRPPLSPDSRKDPERIREIALDSLERRRRTRFELERLLKRKGIQAAHFIPVLDRLTEVGLIDDLEYARVYLSRRAASKPRGARLLKAELMARGVPAALVDQALAEADTDPVADALRALRPWLSRQAGLDSRRKKEKSWQFLARKGFSTGVIERVMAGLGSEVDAGDDG